MSTLDAPGSPNPANVSNRHLALRYGAIWGGASILISLIGFLTNTDPSLPTTGPIKWVYSLAGLAVAIWAITTAIRIDRDQQLGGFIGLGRCVGLGALIGLVAGAIGAAFMLLYTTVINPNFGEQMKEAMISTYEEQGMSEEQIEMTLSMSEAFTNPAMMALFQVVGGAIFGLIIGLIAGAVMKRERPYSA